MVFTRSHSVVKIPSHLFGLGKQMLRSSKSYNISKFAFSKLWTKHTYVFFLAFLDLIKLSISCFSWCHLKQCNSQERKYSWTFKYCVTEYWEVLVSIWSQWPYFTGWLGNVCEKSQWSTIYLLHHLGFCIFLVVFLYSFCPFLPYFRWWHRSNQIYNFSSCAILAFALFSLLCT